MKLLHFQTRGRTTAFTIVELLVVMSIVSLLLAVLLPAMGGARASSKSLLCQTNLHQTQLAMFNYADDFKNSCVPAYFKWASTSTGQSANSPAPAIAAMNPLWSAGWNVAVTCDSVYLGRYTDPSNNGYPQFGYLQSKTSAWLCPERYNNTATFGGNLTSVAASYAINRFTFPAFDMVSAGPPYSTITFDANSSGFWKIDTIKSPSKMMALIDASNFNNSVVFRDDPASGYLFGNIDGIGAGFSYDRPDYAGNFAIRHPNQSTNLSFMDGHVKNNPCGIWTGGGFTGPSLRPLILSGNLVMRATDR